MPPQIDPAVDPGEGWIQLQRRGIPWLMKLVGEGRLAPSDVVVALTLAANQSRQTGAARVGLVELCRQLQTCSISRVSHCVRRLRAAGVVARAGNARYVLCPQLATVGNEQERRNHERVFAAALAQSAPAKPAPLSAIKARHALPSQLEPAAA